VIYFKSRVFRLEGLRRNTENLAQDSFLQSVQNMFFFPSRFKDVTIKWTDVYLIILPVGLYESENCVLS
jgi:hypothetical protein